MADIRIQRGPTLNDERIDAGLLPLRGPDANDPEFNRRFDGQKDAVAEPKLGLATTRQLLEEVSARIDMDRFAGGGGLEYTTVGGKPEPEFVKAESDLKDPGEDSPELNTPSECCEAEEPIDSKLHRLERLEATRELANMVLSYRNHATDAQKLHQMAVIFE